MKQIKDLEPRILWEIFYDLTQIPHPSHHEEKAVAYVVEFGKSLGLETNIDEVGNVIIRKPATPGYENRKTVTLQGHLDMVPQKNSNVVHDFVKDPILPRVDGEWVKATDTTLGADNGIGVAAALAVLKSKTLKHGPIEALFTINEEAGMEGALGLKAGVLKGDIMLNMDSEDEGELYVGCAGGINVTGKFPLIFDTLSDDYICYSVSVTGLRGGHSGLDINLGRGNANKILFRVLKQTVSELGVRLVSVNGGNLRNAIPREAFSVVAVPADRAKVFEEAVNQWKSVLANEYSTADPGLILKAEPTGKADNVLNAMVQDDLINSVCACPNGVFGMSADMVGVVETSNNLAIIRTTENVAELLCLVRSFIDSRKEELVSQIESVLKLAGAKVETSGAYPGWKPNPSSEILSCMSNVYMQRWGKTPEVKAIHAGLECGIIGANYPDLDMISFGPTIRFPHSPDEKVNIETVDKFWEWLTLTLAAVPEK